MAHTSFAPTRALAPLLTGSPNAALVHDYLNQHGGAERVLEAMVDLYPHAPVFTSMYDPSAMPAYYREWDIRPTWIDRVPGSYGRHQWLLPAYPLAFNRMQLPEVNLVLSTSSAFAKMVRPPYGAVHICYTHAPMRFAWDFEQYCEQEPVPWLGRKLLPPFMAGLRWADRASADRVDRFVANSTAVRDRIRAFWRRDAKVIFPPVDVEGFRPLPPDQREDYFLVISRLVPYKRIDLVVEAFNSLGLPLRIIGDGRARRALERQAGPNIAFLGRVSDEQLRQACARCQAAIFMSEDDFGIAQVEVQAAGRPVIALAAGGALDSVRPDETGVWVSERTAAALIEAVRRFESLDFSTERLVNHAQGFSTARFKQELSAFIDETLSEMSSEGAQRWS